MPAKQLVLPEDVQKRARKLPKPIQKRLPKALLFLKANPIAGERLQGKLDGFFKYRLGDYRIVYTFNSKISRLEIVTIEHRQGVYK